MENSIIFEKAFVLQMEQKNLTMPNFLIIIILYDKNLCLRKETLKKI